MGNEGDVEIVIGAKELASDAINKVADTEAQALKRASVAYDEYGYRVGSAMNISMRQQAEMERAIGSWKNLGEEVAATEAPMAAAGEETTRLEQRFERLTTASSYLETGVSRLQRMITGMVFGAAIGAVSGLASEILNLGLHSDKAKKDLDALIKTVTEEAEAWDLHRQKVDKVTESTVALYNAKLVYAQFMEAREGKNIQKEIASLQERNEAIRQSLELMGNQQVIGPFVVDNHILTEEILRNNVAIEQNKVKLEDWQKLMGRMPATVSGVKNAVAGLKFTDAELEQIALGKAILSVAHASYEAQAAIDKKITSETQQNFVEQILFEQDKERRQKIIDLMLREKQEQINLRDVVDLPFGDSFNNFQQKQAEVLDSITKKNEHLNQIYSNQMDRILALSGSYGSLAQSRSIENQAMEFGLQLQNAATAALQQSILTHGSFAHALEQGVATEAAALAAKAALYAAISLALGFYRLAEAYGIPTPGSIAAFTAAAQFAAFAGVAAVGARALYSGSGANGGGGTTVGGSGTPGNNPAPINGPAAPPPTYVNIVVQALDPNGVDLKKLGSTLGPAVVDWIGRGGNTGPVIIQYERR